MALQGLVLKLLLHLRKENCLPIGLSWCGIGDKIGSYQRFGCCGYFKIWRNYRTVVKIDSPMDVITKHVCFASCAASQKAETLRFVAKRELIGKASKWGDGRASLKSASPKARGLLYSCIKNKEAGWSESRGVWGGWGNVIGKKCNNHCSAQA